MFASMWQSPLWPSNLSRCQSRPCHPRPWSLLAGWRMSCGWKHPMASMDGARCIVCLLCWWWVFDIFYYKTALLTCLAKVVSDACIGTTFWQTNLVPVFGGFGAWSRFNWICSGWMQWAVIHLGRVPNRLLALPKEKLAAPLEFWVNRKSPTVGSLTKNWCFLSAGRCPNLVNLQSACFTSYQPRKWHPVASIYILFYAEVSILCGDWALKRTNTLH